MAFFIVMLISLNTHKKSINLAVENNPPFKYQTYSLKKIHGETVFIAIIGPVYNTLKYMPDFCKYVNKMAILSPNEVYSASVYDDSTAPTLNKTLVEIEEGTEAQQDDYSNHFVLQYTYNPVSNYNTCTIFFNGLSGKNHQSIKF